jgi:hypothetical protein
MKNFMQFREDLASGRPAKKPVSSSLLKNMARDNEKAMASGFMKLSPKERAKESKRLGEGMDTEHTMNPTSHVKKEGDKFCVYNMKDKKVASFDTKPEADAYAKKNHDSLMNEEKGRGPTGIAYTVSQGHPDAEDPKTRKKYPERQSAEYKAKFNKAKPGLKQYTEDKDMCSCNCDCGKAICESCGKPKMQKESARDNYDPEISDKRTKEKLRKAGLPPESPKVMEDNLQELSPETLKSYKDKATAKRPGLMDKMFQPMGKDNANWNKNYRNKKNNTKGLERANKRLGEYLEL